MNSTYAFFKKSMVDINRRFSRNLYHETEEKWLFKKKLDQHICSTFIFKRNWSNLLSSDIKREICVFQYEDKKGTAYYAVSQEKNHLLECKIKPFLDRNWLFVSSVFDERRMSRGKTSLNQQTLKNMEQELTKLLIEQPSYRLAVVTGACDVDPYRV